MPVTFPETEVISVNNPDQHASTGVYSDTKQMERQDALHDGRWIVHCGEGSYHFVRSVNV